MCKARARVFFLLGSGVRMSRVGEEEERVRAGQWECGIRMRVGVMATKGGEGREGRQERDEKRREEKAMERK